MYYGDYGHEQEHHTKKKTEEKVRFDLVEYQQMIRNSSSPRELYLISEALAGKKLRSEIGQYELGECMDLIKETIRKLEALKNQMLAEPTGGVIDANKCPEETN